MLSANLGFPRMGPRRELKKAVESYWKGDLSADVLHAVGQKLRAAAWKLQASQGCEVIPANDFSYYDQMLDMIALTGAVPPRFGAVAGEVDLATYFAMARGRAGVPAMEMTKWFDTNYHYIVPELSPGQSFRLASSKIIAEFQEARALGITTRPVLIGPVTFLRLAKMTDPVARATDLVGALLPVYVEVLKQLALAGADWVQIDEPALAFDLDADWQAAYRTCYERLAAARKGVRLMLTTYFGSIEHHLPLVAGLPVDGLHVDLVRASEQLPAVLATWPAERALSLGVVDGRNVWRTDLDRAAALLAKAAAVRTSDKLLVAPSCSLLHVPFSLESETELDGEIRSWLAFAQEKLAEVRILATAVNQGPDAVATEFAAARAALASRAASPRVVNDRVRARAKIADPKLARRKSPFAVRRQVQQQSLQLPLLPTTTIGSFPQTNQIRETRALYKAGKLSAEDYRQFLEREIADVVRRQEELGIDVLVHGEPERNDMVEYFGERLEGFVFTQQGWVQSYGSRCVKPPIIFGDVERLQPMTVAWTRYAQSLTKRPVKGMLTGPVTILQWSFVRDDQPRLDTCRQLAFALRDEVVDLEQAGIRIVQIDEPALREGLPLRQADRPAYLAGSVECFRIAASGVSDETQIHTHMCYAEFQDILPAITALDADVISVESSRSRMELLATFERDAYPNEIGPGVYDIHSPRIPATEEMVELLRAACTVLSPEQIWVNPDCGLKTRGWPEVSQSLGNMVLAAHVLRSEIASQSRLPTPPSEGSLKG